MSWRKFSGPLQSLKLGESDIKCVESTRCLGVEIDCNLKCNIHVSSLIKSFSKKLNQLKSSYFLPLNAKLDFFSKVVLPSVTYGILVSGHVEKRCLMSWNECMFVRLKLSFVWIGTPLGKTSSRKWSGSRWTLCINNSFYT